MVSPQSHKRANVQPLSANAAGCPLIAAVTAAKVGLSRGGRRTADAMRARRPSCFEGFPAAPPRAFACVERADAAERDEAV